MSRLKFEEVPELELFKVKNKKNDYWLGVIKKYKNWKCWVWEQEPNIIMSSDCLQEVVTKLKELDKK